MHQRRFLNYLSRLRELPRLLPHGDGSPEESPGMVWTRNTMVPVVERSIDTHLLPSLFKEGRYFSSSYPFDKHNLPKSGLYRNLYRSRRSYPRPGRASSLPPVTELAALSLIHPPNPSLALIRG